MNNTNTLKLKIQKFGAFLSGMVMPNIGAFIAWGILTALFIPTGWVPNEYLGELVGPTLTYLMPVLIGYTGGSIIYGRRGGVAGALATMGVVVGADITMLIGGMVMGPLGAVSIKWVDKLLKDKVKSGMEMLVNNFTMGFVGFALMIFGFIVVEPIFDIILKFLASGVQILVDKKLMPLTSIFVQPAQVLFLNNAINHGIMVPLGVEQAAATGKSILFLVEANGGVWTGVAVGFALFGTGMAKRSAPAAAAIMGFGGIAEVVFPYVLSKPKTIIAPILGNIAGLLTLTVLGGGTVAAVSPGSFFALLAMTPRGTFFANIAGYVVALVVTAATVGLVLRFDKNEADLEELSDVDSDPEFGNNISLKVKNIVIACDAGMGSSVMAESIMKNKLSKAMLDMNVKHVAVNEIPEETDFIITTKGLEERVKDSVSKYDKSIPIIEMDNLLDNDKYDEIIELLKKHD